jgi:hypothetical protein
MAPAYHEAPFPSSPAKAAETLAGKVAELPFLEVETRQLMGFGPTGGSGAAWRRGGGGWSRWFGSEKKEPGF